MVLSEAIQQFQDAMIGIRAPSTRRWYQRRLGSLLPALGDPEVGQIRLADLRRWRAGLVTCDSRWSEHPSRPEVEGGLSPDTIRGYVRAGKTFFTWLEKEGLVERSPAVRLETPPKRDQEPKAVATADVLAMLEVADVRDRAVLRFLADTGCRVGGLCSLTLASLDLERGQATVREKGRGGGKLRTVFFGEETAAALRLYLKVRPAREGEDRVFLGQRQALTEAGVYQALKRVAARAGVGGRFNPHAFRHGWAREALRNGSDLGTVSRVLGHSGIAVTDEFYGRWSQDELHERHDRFSWINGHGAKPE